LRRAARRWFTAAPPCAVLHREELLELAAGVLHAELCAEDAVEQLGHRPGGDAEQQDDELDELGRVRPDRQPVPAAVRLRDGLV